MGMLFGGWAREEAEEELFYIKKYGLEAGQVAYQQWKNTPVVKTEPEVLVYTSQEPKVTKGDIILYWLEEGSKPPYYQAIVKDVVDGWPITAGLSDYRDSTEPKKWPYESWLKLEPNFKSQ